MRTVDEHLAAVLALGGRLAVETRPLIDANGMVLAEDVVARFAVPPFDNSAMDGFAVRSMDVVVAPVTLRVTEDIAAGSHEPHALSAGEAARIMTGAPLPEGADAIVPVELTDARPGPGEAPTRVEVRETVEAGRHIRRQGENVKVGDDVVAAGAVLTPSAVAAAASVGLAELRVVRRPRVVVIATGSELEVPGEALAPGQVPDSNSVLLGALLGQFGASVKTLTTGDDPGEFRRVLDEAASSADLIVTTGGVSVGAFEVVRQVTEGECEFVSVAMQPGKPQGAGLCQGVPLLAFPGNPVSVFVSAWLFARPLVAKLAGRVVEDEWKPLPAAERWTTPPGRAQYLPVRFGSDVSPAHKLGSGSHAIASLHLANGLARVPADVDVVNAGDVVDVLRTDA